MSVMDEINRIKGAKEDLKSSIEGKGVSVLSSELIDEYANHVDEIAQTGAVSSVNGQIGDVVLDAADVGALSDDTAIPTKTSDLTNDSGFGTYSKPSGGIPKTDLASAVQASLDRADSALQTAPVSSVDGKTGAVVILPAGGTQGQILMKSSSSDYDVEWGNESGGGASDYADLANKPQINSVTLSGNKSASDLGLEPALEIVTKQSSDTSQTLVENKFYIWPTMSALTITCPATGGPYAFRFTSGSTPATLTMTGITMPDSFAVEADRVYEINVLEGYGVATSWEVSSS